MMSTSKRTLTAAAIALLTATAATIGRASEFGNSQVATSGDPYAVTPKRLKRELREDGIDVRFIHTKRVAHAKSVAGVGSLGRAGIGFEFQLYPSSDQASVRRLGQLSRRRFGRIGQRPISGIDVKLRGVLANVAYAQYQPYWEGNSESRRAFLRFDAQYRRVLRALDDALFASFPRDDPYAHALSAVP